jgi:hypothetical protein
MTITLDQTPSTGPGQSPDDQMQQLFDQAYGYGATALEIAGKLDPETLDPTVWDLANTAVQYRDRIADLATRVKNAPVDDEESPVLVKAARGYNKEAGHCAALLEVRAGAAA